MVKMIFIMMITLMVNDIRDFKIQRRGRQREREKKTKGFISKQQLCTCITFFCTFLSCFCTTSTWKCLISRFKGDVNKQRRNFISLSELEYGHLKFSFRRVRLVHLTKYVVGIIAVKTERTQIHFLSDVLVAVALSDLKLPLSNNDGDGYEK